MTLRLSCKTLMLVACMGEGVGGKGGGENLFKAWQHIPKCKNACDNAVEWVV